MTTNQQKQAFIVGSDKGGVGKTEISLQIIFRLKILEQAVAIGEIDSVQRLSMILKKEDVNSTAITDDLMSNMSDPTAADNFFAKSLESVASDDAHASVLDLGASVSGQYLAWMDGMEVIDMMSEDGYRPCFVGVCAPEGSSFAGALRYIEKAQKTAGGGADYALVMNDINGSGFGFLDDEDGQERRNIDTLKGIQPVSIVTVPHAKKTKLVSFAARHNLGIHEAYQLAVEIDKRVRNQQPIEGKALNQVYRAIGLDKMPSRPQKRVALKSEMRILQKWLLEARVAVDEIINKPNPEEVAEAKKTDTSQGEAEGNQENG